MRTLGMNELLLIDHLYFLEFFGIFSCRQDNFLYKYMDATSLRANLCDVLKESVKSNPILQDKLKFPAMDKSRLLTILKKM